MPRKTKETEKIEDITSKKTKAKKIVDKKVTKSSAKSKVDKKASSKTSSAKPKVVTKKVTTNSTAKPKVTTTKKTTAKSTTKNASVKPKVTTTKKAATKSITKKISVKSKTTTKKASTKSTARKTTVKKKYSPEYYDLPFKYNKTVVTLLAQTPTNIFVYWEITKPVLVIRNLTKKYSFEIDINDFANSWYIEVDDSNCKYEVELGRRPIDVNYNYIPGYDINKNGPIEPIKQSYIYISSSNDLVVPNDHVLFNWSDKIYFKNIKTNEITAKNITDFSFIDKIITIYELFKKEFEEYYFQNPSSGNPSSGSFSSIFR